VLIALVLIGLLIASFFVRRYREDKRPVRSWTPTDELFNDPSSSRVMRVWLDQAGTRHYVPEDGRPPS
jgi:hypothetical protein